ncbi:hypothetical protein LT493_15605 [Streptomyces tricolor]|nr:hypothetical protein [Streptomyces tricolor]
MSWRVLLAGLEQAYRQAVAGGPPAGARHPFADWARALAERVRAGDLDDDLLHWTRRPRCPAPAPRRPPRHPARRIRAHRPHPPGPRHHAGPAAPHAPSTAPGQRRAAERAGPGAGGLDRHGPGDRRPGGPRPGGEELAEGGTDLARTVGWFTTQYPVTPDPGRPRRLGCHAQGRQGTAAGPAPPRPELPGTGPPRLAPTRPRGPSAHSRCPRCASPTRCEAPAGGGFQRPPPTLPGRDTDPGAPLDHPPRRAPALAPTANWSLTRHYSDQVHRADTVRRLANGLVRALAAIAEHCARPGAGGRTPHFRAARLDQAGVDASPATAGTWRTCCRSPRSRRARQQHHPAGRRTDDVYVDQAALLLEG